MSAQMSERISKMSDRLSGDMSERMSEDMPDRMSEDMQGMSSSFVRKNAKRFFSKQFVKLGVTGCGCPRVCFDMSCWGSLKVKCSAYVFSRARVLLTVLSWTFLAQLGPDLLLSTVQ